LKLPAHLALSQYRNAALVQLSAVGGIWLVSFLIWWSNFALAAYLLSEGSWRERARRAAPILALLVGSILLGNAWLPISGQRQTVAALQIADCDEATMRKAQLKAAQAGATLAVWPEFGGLAMAPRGDTSILREMEGPPFVTSFRDDQSPLPHNVAALFAEGKESARYAKRKLFGEESKMHVPGDRAVAAGDIGLNICFDSCFPFVIRDTARLGHRLVALPTIDPPSTNGFIAAIHASYTPFRAAENGIAMVRADGYANSMIVDPRGRIVAEAGTGDRILVAQTVLGPRWAPGKWLGDWWLWLCGLLLLIPYVRSRLHSEAKHGNRSKDPVESPGVDRHEL
ncbi:carbon-nitrogen hydrolase family protein, partial [bacterium]